MVMYKNVAVIIPTLNEGDNIYELIKLIFGSYKGITVIVADDGSTDDTKKIVEGLVKDYKNLKFLDRSKSKIHGLTASVIDAVKSSSGDLIVVIDGDLQHPPEKIEEIVFLLNDGADIVIGSRRKVVGDWPIHRKLMSVVASNLARIRLRRFIKDPMSGFFGVKTGMFRSVLKMQEGKFEKEGYKVLFDLLKYSKASVAYVNYDFGERKKGQSKIKSKHVWIMLRSLFR